MNRQAVLLPLLLVAFGCGQSFNEVLFGPSQLAQGAPPTTTLPAPAPTPTPSAAPTPNPPPTPCEDCPDVPSNTNPVVRVGAKVYFLECDGQVVPGSTNATSVRIGCRIHFDCTAKDGNNRPTRPKGGPYWTFADPSLVSGGDRTSYTPTVLAVRAGTLRAWVEIDGVQSNVVSIRLY